MAFWCRAHLIKATLMVLIVLILLNVYNYLLESSRLRSNNMPTVLSSAYTNYAKWPKRTHTELQSNHSGSAAAVSHTHKPAQKSPNDSPPLLTANGTATQRSEDGNTTARIVLANSSVVIPIENGSVGAGAPVPEPSSLLRAIAPSSRKSASSVPNELKECPSIPPDLNGPIAVSTTVEPLAVLERRFAGTLLPGGWHRPAECRAGERVAIVVPYRDRPDHLPVFLANLHALLQRQRIDYGMFVVEQIAGQPFNRAALLNVGFVEAMRLAAWDCFIFHDLDLLPLDDRNLYTCPDQPRHMSVAIDTMGFKLPYGSLFGGVSAMTSAQFRRVNGFSNSFWGWGGEDDDMYNRLRNCGYHLARYPVNIARYTMLGHKKAIANPKRYEHLASGAKRFDSDGLNSMRYKVRRLEKKVLYTWIETEIIAESAS